MSMPAESLLIVLTICVVLLAVFVVIASRIKKGRQDYIPDAKSFTCDEKYDHNHEDETNTKDHPRYIVQEQPENGYIILNGRKRKLTDCKYL